MKNYSRILLLLTLIWTQSNKDFSTTALDTGVTSFVESMSSDASTKDLCTRRGTLKKIRELCKSDVTILRVINKARRLAKSECEKSFVHELWNCNTSIIIPGKVYRETAFLHALNAAALAYSFSQACSKAQLESCSCVAEDSHGDVLQHWKQTGCGDNVKTGVTFARHFLPSAHGRKDPITRINQHNSETGLKMLYQHIHQRCKCHGVSGSCTTRTCSQQLQPFNNIVESLKLLYRRAEVIELSNRVSSGYKALSSKLYYIEQTPSFCKNSRGRQCADPGNCAILCCSKGFRVRIVTAKVHCKCYWKNLISLKCEICGVNVKIFRCN